MIFLIRLPVANNAKRWYIINNIKLLIFLISNSFIAVGLYTMKYKFLFTILLFSSFLIAFSAKAFLCETDTTIDGYRCKSSEGKSWCYMQGSLSDRCRAESVTSCPTIPNGTNTFSCSNNACNLTCNGGWTNCSGVCHANVGLPANCSSFNQCNDTCTACSQGYELIGGVCVGATLKLGPDSVGSGGVIYNSANPTVYVSSNVGIGTTNASGAKLELNGLSILSNSAGANYNENIRLPVSPVNSCSSIVMGGTGTSGTGVGQWTTYKCANNKYEINYNAVDVLTIDTAGYVGIGTNGPNYKLEVNGNIGFTAGSTGINFDNATSYTGWAGNKFISGAGGAFGTSKSLVFNVPTGQGFEFSQNGSDKVVINTSGNVGIASDLNVAGLSTLSGGAVIQNRYFGGSNGGTGQWVKLATIKISSAWSSFKFRVNIASRYYSSNVEVSGYTNSSPSSAGINYVINDAIGGAGFSNSDILVGRTWDGSSEVYDLWIFSNGWSALSYSVPNYYRSGTITDPVFYQDVVSAGAPGGFTQSSYASNNGYLGSVQTVAVGNGWEDHLNLYSNDATNRWNFLVDNGWSDTLRIAYNGGSVEAMDILNDGRVGIGTNWPNYKLDVNGEANFSGNVRISGDYPFLNYSATNRSTLLGNWPGSYYWGIGNGAGNHEVRIGATDYTGAWVGTGDTNLFVDGTVTATTFSGSISNADAVGGVGISRIVYGDSGHKTTALGTDISTDQSSGFYDSYQYSGGPVGANWTHYLINEHRSGGYQMILAQPFWTDQLYVQRVDNSGKHAWRAIIDSGNIGSQTVSNSDMVDSLHVTSSGRNNEASKVVKTDGNGYLQTGYINSSNGDENNASNPNRVWGTNGSDSYLRTYRTSSLSVSYAATAGNVNDLSGTWDTGDNYFLSNEGASAHISDGSRAFNLEAYSTDHGPAGMSFHRSGDYAVNMGLDHDNVFRIGGWSAPVDRWQLDMNGNEWSAGNQWLGGNLTMNNGSPTIFFQDTDHRSAMIHNNSNIFYVLRGCGNNSTSWCTYNSRWPLEINLENNRATFGGSVYATAPAYNYTDGSIGGWFVADTSGYGGGEGPDSGGVYGTGGDWGVWGTGPRIGVYGSSTGGGTGVSGYGSTGVRGYGTWGLYGQTYDNSGRGVYGWAGADSSSAVGVYGMAWYAEQLNAYAGYFNGKVDMINTQLAIQPPSGRPGLFTIRPSGNGSWWNIANTYNGSYLMFRTADARTWNDTTSWGTVNNQMMLSTAGSLTMYNGVQYKPSGGSWTASSDLRLKKDVSSISGTEALDKLSRLNGITYKWINPEEHNNDTSQRAAIMAQNLQQVFPDWVSKSDPTGKDQNLIPAGDSVLNVTYPNDFNAYLIEAIKELKKQNDDLKARLDKLEQVVK